MWITQITPTRLQKGCRMTHWGFLICGSANGVAMTANKHPEVRAAIAWRPDIARLAREHNNANVLCLPARYLAIS